MKKLTINKVITDGHVKNTSNTCKVFTCLGSENKETTSVTDNNVGIKPTMNIKDKIIREIASEPFVEDRIIQIKNLVKNIKKEVKYEFEGRFKNGNYFQKMPNGEYYSVNSLSKIK